MNGLVYRLSQLTVLAAVILLILGGLTTSFRAGMADPVWPTEPWFLIVNGHKYELEQHRGFLLEHTHRAAGFTVGILASVLAIAAWISGPNKLSRILGIIGIVALLSTYGDLHRLMMAAWSLRKTGQGFTWPTASVISTTVSAAILVSVAGLHLASKQSGKWVRFWVSLILIAVMIQGLLGGLRVFLDSELGISRTLGVELAAIHGVFAQLVFAAMVCVPILCKVPTATRTVNEEDRGPLLKLSILLTFAVFLQLIWAAWIRHSPTPLGQRLHLLTAFAVVGIAIWLAMRIASRPNAKRIFGWAAAHLMVMLGVQVLLGVEAWMGKFSAQGPQGMIAPEARQVTTSLAITRTLHQLIGTAILASSVALVLRIWREPIPTDSVGGLSESHS